MRPIPEKPVERSWTVPGPICSSARPYRGAESLPKTFSGWSGLLDQACRRIRGAASIGAIIQAKRGLRLSWGCTAPQQSRNLVTAGVAVCEARRAFDLLTGCDAPAQGSSVQIQAGPQNIDIGQIADIPSRTVRPCRYDRQSDGLVAVDVGSLRSEG